jgi:hypothetical protein
MLVFDWFRQPSLRTFVRYELFLQRVAIGRALQPFPRSKPDRCLSTHPAFQFNSVTSRLQANGTPIPERTSRSTAQPVAWGPPLCRRTRPHYFFRHLLSLAHLLILCSFESPLADLHHVSPITEEHLITTPPPPALPPAGILAALVSTGGVSVP